MDLIAQIGELALGSRLKRVSEKMMQDGIEIYKSAGIDFNPIWFPAYYALSQQDKMTIMELAQVLRVSHPAVIKVSKALEKAGYIESFKEEEDKRKRWLRLSEQGRALLPKLQLTWKDIANGINSALQETSNTLLQNLLDLEQALEKENLLHRVSENRRKRLLEAVEIVEFSTELAPHFKRINYAWIEQYFKVEEPDRIILEYPQQEILDKGGYICFGKVDDEVAGTCALKKYNDELYELVKMGVDGKFRGLQVGKKMGLHIIEKAKAMGCRTLFLESNKALGPALALYQRLGFKQVPLSSSMSEYERADIKMEIQL